MTTRRQLIQAIAVLPVVGLLLPREVKASGLQPFKTYLPPGVWCGKVETEEWPQKLQVRLRVEPCEGSFAGGLQRSVEVWERGFPGSPKYRPVGSLNFYPMEASGKDWLFHPSWDGLANQGDPMTLFTPVGTVFLCRQWAIIDRAVSLRLHAYWRAENPPVPYETMAEGEFRHKFLENEAWRREQRRKLAYINVDFDAERT